MITALTTLTGTPGLVLAGLVPIVRGGLGPRPGAGLGGAGLLVGAVAGAGLLHLERERAAGGRARRTAIYMCLTPLVAALTAWATLGERLVPLQAVGAALILTGVLMTRR